MQRIISHLAALIAMGDTRRRISSDRDLSSDAIVAQARALSRALAMAVAERVGMPDRGPAYLPGHRSAMILGMIALMPITAEEARDAVRAVLKDELEGDAA